jgi:hypothetical protein
VRTTPRVDATPLVALLQRVEKQAASESLSEDVELRGW